MEGEGKRERKKERTRDRERNKEREGEGVCEREIERDGPDAAKANAALLQALLLLFRHFLQVDLSNMRQNLELDYQNASLLLV